ncbi:MAG: type II secretion system F family protein [Clostridia bacterium]|nr:type II secretion system F family protein [Clostridia bacterium]
MPEYRYRAMNREGRYYEGSFTADTEVMVTDILRERGLLPIKVIARTSGILAHFRYTPKVNPAALALFCRQMSLVLRTGVTILKGLEILRVQMPDHLMRQEADRMYREVQTGRTLSESMSGVDSRIPALLARMVATGEASGNLDEILLNMAQYYEQETAIRKKIKGALVYPVLLTVVSVALLFFVFTYLIPQIEILLAGTGAQLPALTRFVLGVSHFIQVNFLLFMALLAGLFVLMKTYTATPQGRLYRDRIFCRLPALGPVLLNITTARFARTAAIVFRSGIPLFSGLELIRQNVENAVAEQAVDFAADGVHRGESLATELDRAKFFDPMAIQMVRIGEETGSLDDIMAQMAEHYDRQAQAGIAQLLTLIEPVMLLVMGGIIGTVVLSVMMPLFDLIGNIK